MKVDPGLEAELRKLDFIIVKSKGIVFKGFLITDSLVIKDGIWKLNIDSPIGKRSLAGSTTDFLCEVLSRDTIRYNHEVVLFFRELRGSD